MKISTNRILPPKTWKIVRNFEEKRGKLGKEISMNF